MGRHLTLVDAWEYGYTKDADRLALLLEAEEARELYEQEIISACVEQGVLRALGVVS